jgi:3-oxoacyl-[acyl-carrier-protein] synthase II
MGHREARRRAVITGVGVVTALGTDVETFWRSIVAGRSGISAIELFDAGPYPTRIAGEVKGFTSEPYVEKKEARLMGRFTQFGVVAGLRALEDAALEVPRDVDAERFGIIIGSGAGGQEVIEDQALVLHRDGLRAMNPYYGPMMLINIVAAHLTIRTGARGHTVGMASACAAGAHAIGEGLRLVQHDEADVMVCGGTEAPIHPLGLAGFCAMRALSTRNDDPEHASRPFDRRRDGFVMSEGAAVVVVEELQHALARGRPIYAELVGYGSNTDGYHMTAPRPDGKWQACCMERALGDAGLEASQVDYLNTHATATKVGDIGETRAIKTAFGEHASRLACSSTKSMTGHLLGAAGAVEAVVAALSVRDDLVPPTINLDDPDPQCDLDFVPGAARHTVVRAAMSNSFGFGGHNAVLAFAKAPAAR